TCTRRFRFCSVKTGLPRELDWSEPRKVAVAVEEMQLQHVVITMVNRDELPDGGSQMMANTVRAIKKLSPLTSVEVLSSDMMGNPDSIAVLMEAKAEIMSHNLETVQRLTPLVRSRSTYQRSLDFLRIAGELDPAAAIKSSVMVGLGETVEELHQAMDDLLANGVRMMNIGQYLQPTRVQLPVQKYYHPDEFAELREAAIAKGFAQVHSGPLVRSSYHAGENYSAYRQAIHPLAQDPELRHHM
ncbi:MAG: lipoyl synthase, partial [Spirochaeta sp.]